jgi:flavin reductase (DIM6/NTAB) family NADH-FMN oxidoreductase RutF
VTRKPIPFHNLRANVHLIWSEQGMLLTSGDFAAGQFNTMTVGWGSLGIMWGRPFVQVVVRPTRYTYEFMEQYDTFTLCAFPEAHRQALQLLGTKSGRDGDKIAEAGLTPIASTQVPAPGFAEADLIVECRKMYWQDMDPTHFLDPETDSLYPGKHYHRIYFGEVVAINGTEAYVDHA